MIFTWKGQPSKSVYPANTRPETNVMGPMISRPQRAPETTRDIRLATIPRYDPKQDVWNPGTAYYDPIKKGVIFEKITCTTVGTRLPKVCIKRLPRPLKVWRKRLNHPESSITSKASINQLNGSGATATNVPVSHNVLTDIEHIKENCHSKRSNGECTAIRRSAGACSKNYATTTKEYLQKRCKTYDQNETMGRKLALYTYTSGQGSENPGVTGICNKIIIKPSNSSFQQQGGVSSSSRTNKLKYETVMANAAVANYATARATLDGGYLKVKGQNHPPTGCVSVRQDRAHESTCLPKNNQ